MVNLHLRLISYSTVVSTVHVQNQEGVSLLKFGSSVYVLFLMCNCNSQLTVHREKKQVKCCKHFQKKNEFKSDIFAKGRTHEYNYANDSSFISLLFFKGSKIINPLFQESICIVKNNNQKPVITDFNDPFASEPNSCLTSDDKILHHWRGHQARLIWEGVLRCTWADVTWSKCWGRTEYNSLFWLVII